MRVLPPRTVRLRLTALYGVLFLVSGAVLLAISGGVVVGRSSVQAAPAQNGQITCKFNQFRVALGYGGLTQRGLSAATSFGFDAETKQLQFATAQTTYNWDCCGLNFEYRRFVLGPVRNESQYRFAFSLANIGTFGNLRRQERVF